MKNYFFFLFLNFFLITKKILYIILLNKKINKENINWNIVNQKKIII